MTIARQEIVPDGVEGIFHCVVRCVRRAFLCGKDPYTGKSFEHRRDWVRDRLELLAGSFAMEICAFAVMSNHLHVILRTRPDWA
ncbi:MAG: transposase, partial [Pseudomonadota bacterium]